MYSILMLLPIGVGVWLAVRGGTRRQYILAAAGVLLAIGTAFFFWFMDFWGEMLWFGALGYAARFWEAVVTQVLAAFCGGLFGALLVYVLTWGMTGEKRPIRLAALVLAALIGASRGAAGWETVLKFIHAAPTELQDPIFRLPVGFYLFHLPFYDIFYELLLVAAAVALLTAAVNAFVSLGRGEVELTPAADTGRAVGVYRCAGALLLVLALGKMLERYHLMFSEWGVVTGPGWTDVNVRLPALSLTAAVFVAAAVVLIAAPLRLCLLDRIQNRLRDARHAPLYLLGGIAGFTFAVQVLALTLLPGMFQWLRVEPNEITFERPYIANNIRFTRHGFKLHTVEEREYPAMEKFTRYTVEQNPTIFSNIRLWDWRALDAVYKQFQEIRLYYEFHDVDVDRYTVNGDYQQVMVSAREMEVGNLPQNSQTFVNRRFKYTHGYGITMTNVSEFTAQGLPDLLIRDIPPTSRFPALAVERPQIYYGELTNTPVVVNTTEEEFDYPKGEENAYIRYPGNGGVRLENLWRKLLFGWIAGMSDQANYGRFLAYKFPKEKRVLGPQQVETKIDQDRFLSGQLTLWDQRGSRVIRGNVLAIPIEKTLLYVEPIYLQAETAAYPELRLVALMHNDVLSYAETFDKALEGLLKEGAPVEELPGPEAAGAGRSVKDLVRRAGEAFDNYLQALGEKQYSRASDALEQLESALQRLEKNFPAADPQPSGSRQGPSQP